MKRWIQTLAAVVLLAGLVVPCVITSAQDAPKAKDEKKAEKKTEAAPEEVEGDGLTVPFEFEGLIFIQVKVNGKGPYKFLFDSGATQSVINQRLSKEFGLEEHDMPGGGGVQGVGEAEAKLVVLDNLQIGGYERGKCVAASMNLDHMSGTLGWHMMGIVGQNVIKMMKQVEIDFGASKLSITKYGADEMPTDSDATIISMLEGGGIPGLPGGIPGLPKPGDDKPKKDEGGKDDEFSVGPMQPMSAFLLQDMGSDDGMGEDDGDATTTGEGKSPTEGQTISYTTVSLPMMGELVPYWYVKCEINGEEKTFMFDTGASMLLAIGEETAADLKLTESFGYPVKGVGKGQAKSSMVESFAIGNLQEEDLACTIMALPKMSDQLPDMIKMFLPFLKQRGIALDFDGIVGISLAARYQKMIVNTQTKEIEFVPYEKGAENMASPYESEEFVKDAVIRTWHGKAGKFGLTGDAVTLDDWKKYGLEKGGMIVEEVEEGGAAAKAGIKKGDIITHLVGLADEMPEEGMEDADTVDGDVVVRDMPALIMFAASKDPGSELTVRVKRGDKTLDLKVTLDKYGWEGTIPERWKQK
ncbi:MAG: aspartyl protease family protein [Planctomycetes bacterium]|nr:aspartyl protease family protein [Planctomycetota bacterium]